MRTYRRAFLIALAVNIVFAAALSRLGWRVYQLRRARSAMPSAPLGQPSASVQEAAAVQGVSATETPLSPVQLSPERLQSIGVRTGTVELKDVQDDVRVTGDVEVDEERL